MLAFHGQRNGLSGGHGMLTQESPMHPAYMRQLNVPAKSLGNHAPAYLGIYDFDRIDLV